MGDGWQMLVVADAGAGADQDHGVRDVRQGRVRAVRDAAEQGGAGQGEVLDGPGSAGRASRACG